MLEGLSEDLAVAVQRQGGDLGRHLHSLPPSLHPAAIHAAFPALKSHSPLSIDCAEHSVMAPTAALSTFAALSATPSTKKLLLSNLDAVLSASTCRCQVKTFEVALKHALVSGRSVLSISCLPRLYCAPKENKRVLRLIRSGIWANTNLRELDIQLQCNGSEAINMCPYVACHIGKLTRLQALSLDTFSDFERCQITFINAVRCLTHLTRLVLMSDVGPQVLAQVVAPLGHLQSLTANMQHPRPQPFPDRAIDSLAGAISRLTSLTNLRFHHTCTHQKCMPQLMDVCLPVVSVMEALAVSCHCTCTFRGGNAGYVIQQQDANVPDKRCAGNAWRSVVAQCTEAMPSCLSCVTLDCEADGASKALF